MSQASFRSTGASDGTQGERVSVAAPAPLSCGRRIERIEVEVRQTALSRGFAIHYEDSGGPGPPLVLVNGYASPAREWAERGYVAELVGRFRVFAVDRSRWLADSPSQDT